MNRITTDAKNPTPRVAPTPEAWDFLIVYCMYKRKSLSKKKRFEVFKRDSFKCQYCGRSAPDVILEVDHIVPVAEGGKNDMLNLVTSCRDCNRGKGKRLISDNSAVERQKKQLEEMNEIREQTQMLIDWKKELLEIEEQQIKSIEEMLITSFNQRLTEDRRRNFRKLIKKYGFQEVYTATEIAFAKYDEPFYAFDKIGGICYNRKWRS